MRFTSNVTRVLTVAGILWVPALGQAQTATATTGPAGLQRVEFEVPQPVPAMPIAEWRIATEREPTAARAQSRKPYGSRPPARRARLNTGVKRALAGAALGLGGFLAGGLIGARIEGTGCGCDDPGLKGFVIGAPIGAVIGAVIGVAAVR